MDLNHHLNRRVRNDLALRRQLEKDEELFAKKQKDLKEEQELLERVKAREQEFLRQRVIKIHSERERQRQLRRICFEIDANQQIDN